MKYIKVYSSVNQKILQLSLYSELSKFLILRITIFIAYVHHSVMIFYLRYNYNLSNWYMWFMYPFEFGHEQHNVVQKIELFSLFGKVKQSIEKASSILNRILEEYVLFLLIMYIYLMQYLISEEKQRFVFDPLEIRRE